MSETKLPYGKPVKLLIDLQGFPDGRLVLFQIWRKKGGNEEKITEVYGVTKGGKGVGRWTPMIERKEILRVQEKTSEQVEEEKYYFIAKIDDQEVKSGDMVLVYPLDIYLEDKNKKPLHGIKYKITFSDGSTNEGKFENGHAKFPDAPPGKFELEVDGYEFVYKPPGKIIKAFWGKNKVKIGDEVKMVVDVKDFDDGTKAKFEIWEKGANEKKDLIDQIDGEVQKNKVEAVWVYSTEDVEGDVEEDEEEKGEPEYFFDVTVEEEKARSGILKFTHVLEIYLEDEKAPLDDVKYRITLSDGTVRTGRFENGWAKIENAPFGNFFLAVENYDIVIK
jgi:hypothetical protein